MKFLKGVVFTLVVVILVFVLILGYFGFMPGVSTLFVSNKPRDLGVVYSAADYASAHARNGTTHTVLPPGTSLENSIKFSGQHAVNTTYTQAEFNALINNRQWQYYPLSNCQLKVNPDNSVEFSGTFLKSRLDGYLTALKTSPGNVQTVKDYIKLIPEDPAFYAKGKFEIVNGQITGANVQDFEVGKVNLTTQARENLPTIINAAYSQFNSYPGFSVKTLKFVDGKVQFEGTLPDSARTVSQ